MGQNWLKVVKIYSTAAVKPFKLGHVPMCMWMKEISRVILVCYIRVFCKKISQIMNHYCGSLLRCW